MFHTYILGIGAFEAQGFGLCQGRVVSLRPERCNASAAMVNVRGQFLSERTDRVLGRGVSLLFSYQYIPIEL